MPSPTDEFFAALRERGHEPLLERVDQTVRVDMREDGHTEHWRLTVRHGDLRVSQDHGDADCVITTTRDVFDRIASGRTKPLPAWLRNDIVIEGRLYPLLVLERLLPAPPGSHDPRALAESMITDAAWSGGRAAGP